MYVCIYIVGPLNFKLRIQESNSTWAYSSPDGLPKLLPQQGFGLTL